MDPDFPNYDLFPREKDQSSIYHKRFYSNNEKFLELKKDYKKNKIPLLASFEKNYKLSYSKQLVKILRKKKFISNWQLKTKGLHYGTSTVTVQIKVRRCIPLDFPYAI